MPPKYAQIHRQLLFHWSSPSSAKAPKSDKAESSEFPLSAPKSQKERLDYVELLRSVLLGGLRFSKPDEKHAEYLVKGSIEAKHRMLCFSEWNVGGAQRHASRYGLMGFGFTRKFIMDQGGRPVIYLPNKKYDPIREALEKILIESKKNDALAERVALLESSIKTYNLGQKSAPRSENKNGAGKPEKTSPLRAEDNHLGIHFGGLFKNLEDKEWRILEQGSNKSPEAHQFATLPCTPGHLAMIVLPDHETLAHVMQDGDLPDMLYAPGKPAICLLTREMLFSI